LSAVIIDDNAIPECGDWEKNKPKNGPKYGLEYTIKPGGKEPEDGDQEAREDEGDNGEGARHGERFFIIIKLRRKSLSATLSHEIAMISPGCFDFFQHRPG